jgi:dehydration protein DpgD
MEFQSPLPEQLLISSTEATKYEFVEYAKNDHVAYITLNRPEVHNALNIKMHYELGCIWDDFEADEDIWVGVLTGTGEKAFSVGQDLKELALANELDKPSSSLGSAGSPGWPRLTERFSLNKPLIARVDGYAFGGGFELALACDLVIASDRATFALPEAKLGLIPGAGGIFRLTRQAPLKVAMGHLLTGKTISASRAYELGLVNEMVPPSDLDRCVADWICDLKACAPLAVRSIKEVCQLTSHLSLERAFAQSSRAEEIRRTSKDAKEGPLAFVEKRKPKWIGQ